MKIGFDAKRAFHNNTGLGNYSRDTIRILGTFYPQHHYLLYTPKAKTNQRLEFLKDIKNVNIRTPKIDYAPEFFRNLAFCNFE